jgi:hypothetical protein
MYHSDTEDIREYYVTLDFSMTKIITAHKVLKAAQVDGRRAGAVYVATGWRGQAPSGADNANIKIMFYKDWTVFVDLKTLTDTEGNPVSLAPVKWEVLDSQEISSVCKIVTEKMTLAPGLQVLRDVIMIRPSAEDDWVAEAVTAQRRKLEELETTC